MILVLLDRKNCTGEPGSLSRHTPVGDEASRQEDYFQEENTNGMFSLTDDNGVTTRSDTYGFVVDNSPPEISLISPVDGGTVIQSYVDLVWSSYDPDGDRIDVLGLLWHGP